MKRIFINVLFLFSCCPLFALSANLNLSGGISITETAFTAPASTPTFSSMTVTNQVNSAGFKIGANELTTAEFAYLDGQNQGVKTTDAVTHSTITWTNQSVVRASAYRNAALTTAANVITSILFDVENYDTDSALVVSSFTVPTTGGYHIDASVMYTNLNTDKWCKIYVFVNNVETRTVANVNSYGGIQSVSVSCDIALLAGQIVDIRTAHISGEDPEPLTPGLNATWMDIRKVW